ncbi:PfkB family carbohydrate kinase [Consotaella salsifontis]|uniref:Sulfofructose kinase n=1 Tax=Consotaella salsifontis TaxID=1365950 RepID=A0A1T4SHE7_9HYPH|nr:PfkB family carbohydrate kinase [Consotaella salsifontis]SKA27730.1 sulfofructose kinase [Consotaella salsifontis]
MARSALACVGSAVLDRIYRVEEFPFESGKYVARGYAEVGGGPAATAAVAAVRLGWLTHLVAPVGEDDGAISIINELAQWGVITRDVHKVTGATSSTSAVLVDAQGERIIVNHRHPLIDSTVEWIEEIDFSVFTAVLADVRWPRGSERALSAARRAGVTTLLDGDVCPDDISPLVALADHVAFSQPGLQRFTGTDDLRVGLGIAANKTSGTVYVTVGEKGCYWLEEGRLCHCDGFKVKVVDTTGAGDVFHGALLVALAEGLRGRKAIRFASATAALKCLQPGGRSGIPDRSQLGRFMESARETL